METGVNLWAIIVLCLGLCMGQDVWENPFFEDPGFEGVWVFPADTTTISMFEELTGDVIIAIINYSGSEEPRIDFMEPGANGNNFLGAKFERHDDNRWRIVTTIVQDYENSILGTAQRYMFQVTIGQTQQTIILNIVNINDHQPSVIADNAFCNIRENSMEPPDCKYTISDEDGWLDDVGWELSEYREIFQFDENNRPSSNLTKQMQTSLYNIQKLDFEETQMFLFDWTIQDTRSQVEHTRTTRVVVQVIDEPDTPPSWRSIFASQTFNEKEPQTFLVEAFDGDININAPIFYYISDTEWDEYISIKDPAIGEITVLGINRDKHNQQIYSFKINACEVPDETSCIVQEVTFIVNDINDNSPKISADETTFTINENSATMEITVSINDIDMGDNAMYTVSLENDESSTQFHEAFSVVPSRGYQETDVFVFITNNRLLDYEVEEWRSFEFQLVAQEDQEADHVDRITFKIELVNLNDEFPIFLMDEYSVEIKETLGIGERIHTVFATDRDVDDEVIHELLGMSILQRFEIDEETGVITTKLDRSFDYEVQSEVIVQVQATDTLFGVGNRAVAQLTITVLDENDETPRISVASGRIEILENADDGYVIDENSITATDEDTDASLTFSIDWKQSYATKNGQRITDEDFAKYQQSVLVDTIEGVHTGAGAYVSATLKISETVEQNTPDHEVFDVLFISLIVEDSNQIYGIGQDSVMVPIYINDDNDEPPVFNENTIDSDKSVNENSAMNTLIGVIIATDVDGPSITYTLTAIHDTPDGWVSINDRGELRVSSPVIDADEGPIYFLEYEVVASDGKHNTKAEIKITVNDLNDNAPIIDIINRAITVDEKSPSGTHIQTIHATDADRDPPNNVVTYHFNDGLFTSFFSIDRTSGEVIVEYDDESQVLDRDNGIPAVIINFSVHARDGGNQRSDDEVFAVTLKDINDNAPIIQKTSISTREDLKAGATVDQITAIDKDEEQTDNTKVAFEILDIRKDSFEKDPPDGMFTVTVTNEFSPATADLISSIDLREYYGTYIVTMKTTDFGEEPQSDTREIRVIVDMFNFVAPSISDPSNGAEFIYLAMTQQVGRPLTKYDGVDVDTIKATDNQGEKWTITLSVLEGETVSDLFTIQPNGRNTGYLTINSENFEENKEYELTIVAQDNGTPTPLSTRRTIKIKFIDETAEPVFVKDEEDLKFLENQTLTQSLEFPIAQYAGIGGDLGFHVYYHIRNDPSNSFIIDPATTNFISLPVPLDREVECCYTLTLEASRQASGNINPESVLILNIELEDINDNPPNFDSEAYYSTIMLSSTTQTIVLTVSATDLDDTSALTYAIDPNSFDATGTNIDNIRTPFVINRNTGVVNPSFSVLSSMNGFFKFTVVVSDTEFEDTATVHVYIVNELHRVEFIFENDVMTVESKRAEIIEILEDEFGLSCNIEVIQWNTNANGEPMDDQTVVRVHFINTETNEPVLATEIESQANDLDVYKRLRATFLLETLVLLSFSQNTEPDDNTADILRGWLIGVSIVLGTLCMILLVAFILKVRSLTSRLNKLSVTKYGSQESGLNRKAAPTTNLHAAEGTNPAFAEEKKLPEYDEISIGSADSDLVGVENNPEFQYNNKNFN